LNEWKCWLNTAQYVLNDTVRAAIKNTPFKLLLGYAQREHTDIKLANFVNHLAKVDNDIIKERESSKDSAKAVMDKLKEHNKHYYDLRHRKPTLYRRSICSHT